MKTIPLEAKRVCGGCHACCILPSLDEGGIQKNGGERCPKLNGIGKCSIYPGRPKTCREFKCGWLAGKLPEGVEYRPDKLGLMVGAVEIEGFVAAQVYEVWKGAAETEERANKVVQMLMRENLVMLVDNHEPRPCTRILGPQPLVEAFLGAIGQEKLREAVLGRAPRESLVELEVAR